MYLNKRINYILSHKFNKLLTIVMFFNNIPHDDEAERMQEKSLLKRSIPEDECAL